MAHDVETRDRALTALALAGGSSTKAAALLQENGTPVDDRTLRDWRTRHAGRYDELRANIAPRLEQAIEHDLRSLVTRLHRAEELAADTLIQQLENGEVKDVPSALRNISTAKGINVDKLLTVTGRPNHITETRNADDLIRKLESLRLATIESTATELPAVPLIAETVRSNAREPAELEPGSTGS